jgi:hypothetical protein
MDFHDYCASARKLTKEYLLGLDEGFFLVGNICDHHYRPAFAEVVASESERLQQWERIKAVGANGRLSDLFKDRTAFVLHARRKRESARRHGYTH